MSFMLIIIFIAINYAHFLQGLEKVAIEEELESRKIRINRELMEIARARTGMTAKIINIEDPMESIKLRVESLDKLQTRLCEKIIRVIS